MKRLRIPETVLDVQRVGVVRGVENVEVAHLVFIGGANLKMTLYLISMYGKVTEFPVDCMLLYAEVDSRKCDCDHGDYGHYSCKYQIRYRVYKYYRG